MFPIEPQIEPRTVLFPVAVSCCCVTDARPVNSHWQLSTSLPTTSNSPQYVSDSNRLAASLRGGRSDRRVPGSDSYWPKASRDSSEKRRVVERPLLRHRKARLQTPSSISPPLGAVLDQIKEGFLLGGRWPGYNCKAIMFPLFPFSRGSERREL
jgi:hypothetical protein